MKFKIVSIKKRGLLARIGSINYWKVKVEDENGNIIELNCWANIIHPNNESLGYSINDELHKYLNRHPTLDRKEQPTLDTSKLVGREIDLADTGWWWRKE